MESNKEECQFCVGRLSRQARLIQLDPGTPMASPIAWVCDVCRAALEKNHHIVEIHPERN